MATDQQMQQGGQGGSANRHILVVTSDNIPGYEITETLGHVFGLIVRSRDAVRSFGAGVQSIFGGELGTLTRNVEQARETAVDRMVGMALGKGADAVIAMRYDSGEQNGFGEICAYGTAVKVRGLQQNQ